MRDVSFDVVVIDDGSHRRSHAFASRTSCRRFRSTSRHRQRRKRVFKYALEHGYQAAVSASTAIGSTIWETARKLLAPLLRGDADIVTGSRFAAGGEGYRPPFARRIGIHITGFARLVSLFTGSA